MTDIYKRTSLFVVWGMALFYASIVLGAHDAMAATQKDKEKDFSDIAENIITSIEDLPGLVTGIAYLVGLYFGVTGILKLKTHIEEPEKTALKEGAIRMATGGALFALPIIYEAMRTTVGETPGKVGPAALEPVEFNVGN